MIMFRLELITISRGKEDITLSGILRVIQEKVFHRFREKNALADDIPIFHEWFNQVQPCKHGSINFVVNKFPHIKSLRSFLLYVNQIISQQHITLQS